MFYSELLKNLNSINKGDFSKPSNAQSVFYKIELRNIFFYCLENYSTSLFLKQEGPHQVTLYKNYKNLNYIVNFVRCFDGCKKIYTYVTPNSIKVVDKKIVPKNKNVQEKIFYNYKEFESYLVYQNKKIKFFDSNKDKFIKLNNDTDMTEIFIDGSYSPKKHVLGIGFFVYSKIDGEIYRSGNVIDSDDLFIGNEATFAEIEALLEALRWCLNNKINSVVINYDCAGLLTFLMNYEKSPSLKKGYFKYIAEFDYLFSKISVFFNHSKTSNKSEKLHNIAHKLSRIGIEKLY